MNKHFSIEDAPEIKNRFVTKTYQPDMYQTFDHTFGLDEQTTCYDGPSFNPDLDAIFDDMDIGYYPTKPQETVCDNT